MAEARLQGSEDLLIVESLHTVIMDHAQAVEATIRFLKNGRCNALNYTSPVALTMIAVAILTWLVQETA